MSDSSATKPALPRRADIVKLIAQLRDDQTPEVRAEVANRLVVLAAKEEHPRAKSALLQRASGLVRDQDPGRSSLLLRESFRLHPRFETGQILESLSAQEPASARMGRRGLLLDAIALVAPPDRGLEAKIQAAQAHIEVGHGARAQSILDSIDTSDSSQSETISELRQIAEVQIQSRQDSLEQIRAEIAEAKSEDRANALQAYAEILLLGDGPLAEIAEALQQALEGGADVNAIAPVWAEVARALGEPKGLARALAASLDCAQPDHERLRTADELANRPYIDRDQPAVAQRALQVLRESLPDDLSIEVRLVDLQTQDASEAEGRLHELMTNATNTSEAEAEVAAALALARRYSARQASAEAQQLMERVRAIEPNNAEALSYFEAQYRANDDSRRLLMILSQQLHSAAGDARRTLQPRSRL